jgi:serine/threonine-protein kinase RsbW
LANISWNWTAEHHLPSDTKATNIAVADLLHYLQNTGWSEREVFGIHMAVEEALVNAIQHGNQEDPAKFVHVRYQAAPYRLRIEITDEGPGFLPANVADPTSGERLCQPNGRGLLLMKAYMSKVEYLGCGNQLVMEKRRKRKANAA